MKIHWKKPKIKKYVETFARSNPVTARRMTSIKVAKDFTDLECPTNGRAHFLKGKDKGKFAIDLERKGNGNRIICIPEGDFIYKDGQYVKKSITELMILEVKDYHK